MAVSQGAEAPVSVVSSQVDLSTGVVAPTTCSDYLFFTTWGSDSNGAESHAKRRFPDSLGVGGLALEPRSRIGSRRARDIEEPLTETGIRGEQSHTAVGTDEFWIDVVAGERIQRPVVGTAIEAPEARRAEVCEPWTELVPQQPEEPEDKVAVGSGIGHDLDRAQARLVLVKGRARRRTSSNRRTDSSRRKASRTMSLRFWPVRLHCRSRSRSRYLSRRTVRVDFTYYTVTR